MKKIILLFTLVLAIILISGYKQYERNSMTERIVKPVTAKDITGTKKTGGKPKILFMLNNSTGMPGWSPSLWWKYDNTKSGQTGC